MLNYFKAYKESSLVSRLSGFWDFELGSTAGCVGCCHPNLSFSPSLIMTGDNITF